MPYLAREPLPADQPPRLHRFELLVHADQLAEIDARRHSMTSPGRTRRPPSRSAVIRDLLDVALAIEPATSPAASLTVPSTDRPR